ncbi:MAG: glucose-1-phosphate thymidylyltransferase RfbA [Asticcacaulis sp.]
MKGRKGILLAGGSGSRLWPITLGTSKQLLPVYDKPMVYYPLTTLMLAGIREVALITTPDDQRQFQRLLGDGSQWGIQLEYILQPSPDGLAQAFILSEEFLDGAPSALILGDNIFFGHGLPEIMARANQSQSAATVFSYRVSDPERYGVLGYDTAGQINQIVEKPANPPSNQAVTGLYFVDESAPARARGLKPSARGELEITCLLQSYLDEGALGVEPMGRGFAWLDTGTYGSLLDAGNFVRTLTLRQGLLVGSPDEVAYRMGFINQADLMSRAETLSRSDYGKALRSVAEGG